MSWVKLYSRLHGEKCYKYKAEKEDNDKQETNFQHSS